MSYRMICLAGFFSAGLACLLPLSAPHAQIATLTVGQFINGLQELVQQLDTSAQGLIQQGHSDLAQQQMLAEGIVKSLISDLQQAYKEDLDQTFGKVAVTQGNLAADAQDILEQVRKLEGGTAVDAQAAIYKLQGASNQLLNRIPLTTHIPVFYGMSVADIFSELPNKGYDIEFLGYQLTDAALQFKKPNVTVEGNAIPEQNLSVQEDRVQVLIPDEMKKKIGYTNDFCSPRPHFSAGLTVFYAQSRGFWPVSWQNERDLRYNAFALANPERFSVEVTYAGVTRMNVQQPGTFLKRSAYTGVGCEEGGSANVSYNAPAGAKQINCSASWVDGAGIKNETASCAVGGATVTASGTIRGRDRQCIVSDVITGGLFKAIVGRKTACNCPGGGHGTLQLTGTYFLDVPTVTDFSPVTLSPYTFGYDVNISIPSDSARDIRNISLVVHRDRCPANLDSAAINLPSDQTIVARQASDRGLFQIQYRNQTLSIKRSD